MSDLLHDLLRVAPLLNADPATVSEREQGCRIQRLLQRLAAEPAKGSRVSEVVPLQARAG